MGINADVKVGVVQDYLHKKSVALCVSGGIASIETPKIARQLRRFGAEVSAYMTPSALSFVGKSSLEWGTGNEVITELSGKAEHLCFHDAVLVAPATLNTINKVFTGIADSPVTTLIASALGAKVPVFIAPTMHESLYNNPFFQKNLKTAKDYGVRVIHPRFDEGKAKIPRLENIVATLTHELVDSSMHGKRVLITGGPTPGKIDDVRSITNRFKGTLAVEIAKEAYHQGADVKLLLGPTGIAVPSYIDVLYHEDYYSYHDNIFSELAGQRYDVGIFSAAVADYLPAQCVPGKIPSKAGFDRINLVESAKIIRKVRNTYPELCMVTFKYTLGKTQDELFQIAQERINSDGYELVVANRGEEMKTEHNAYIFGKSGLLCIPRSKKEIAKELLRIISESV